MTDVHATDDPAQVLAHAGHFLLSRPVEHNIILTLLHQRVEASEPGHYWWITDEDSVVGVGFQSPVTFSAAVTPMAREHVDALVAAIDVALPGIIAEAATAAAFAGSWAQRHRSVARPVEGQRLYRLAGFRAVVGAAGRLRRVEAAERRMLEAWIEGFTAETAGAAEPASVTARRYLVDESAWIWDDDGPACLTRVSPVVGGVARLGPVFTPPERRGCGYATACVGRLSQTIEQDGNTAILYTQLENPTSNAIYRRIGYRPVLEVLSYGFSP
ncbi:MAG TPA: GNAT family N-acetyltransferase [Acidimicrobiia bacterium]|nr:GNAT family N-acetyltransferase [Acidimicrobiia bacterium]